MSLRKMTAIPKAMGGYFELALPDRTHGTYSAALKYQSARSAFLALLRTCRPQRVWLPTYLCDAMLAPVRHAGIELCFYAVDAHLGIATDITLASTDMLLYVNYFGLCDAEVDKVLARFDPQQVVLDYSQAFYAQPRACLATIYSPRKFFPLPDGGLLFTAQPVEPAVAVDERSLDRMRHLLRRCSETPESGYSDYQRAEASLEEDIEPKAMSCLTSKLFQTLDVEQARIKRNANFGVLHAALGASNLFPIRAETVNGPLSYPWLVHDASLRQKLIAERIFVPTYWPDVRTRADASSWAAHYADRCLALPCDQRYGLEDMDRMIKLVRPWIQ
jgi:hypothetical protein